MTSPSRHALVVTAGLVLGACGATTDLEVDVDVGAGCDDASQHSRADDGVDGSVRVSDLDASAIDARDGLADGGLRRWPVTWGGAGLDRADRVAVGTDGSVIVVGEFARTVDFDPGPGVDERTAATGVFVSKFAADGTHLWVRSFGADTVTGVTTSADGSILVVGSFVATVDFDTGPGIDERTAAGLHDSFLTKLSSDGSYGWTRTWGAAGRDYAWGVGAASDGSIFVAGAFEGTVDFDPGPAVDDHTSNGDMDAFAVKLDGDGLFLWARTWGGPEIEYNVGRLGVDRAGSVVVAGNFRATVDFDPGPGTQLRTAAGPSDLFVIELLSDGSFGWVRTASATGGFFAYDLASTSDGATAVVGIFSGTASFDATNPLEIHTAGSQYDAFVMRLDGDGGYVWTRVFGSTNASSRTWPYAAAVTIADDGRVVVGGGFSDTVDFDPGVALATRTSVFAGQSVDAFAVSFLPDGTFDRVRTWGGDDYDYVLGLAQAHDHSVVAVGFFGAKIDLATGVTPEIRVSNGGSDAFALEW